MAILKWLGWGLALFLAGFLYVTSWEPVSEAEAVSVYPAVEVEDDAPPPASSVVQIKYEKKHGSGVHVGNGYLVTAAHVIQPDKEFIVKDETGRVRKAEVLWFTKVYDIALLRLEHHKGLKKSNLACDIPRPGTEFETWGYPRHFKLLRFRGVINGEETTFKFWKVVVPGDVIVSPGMSGGPVFDHAGDVIGISTGRDFERMGMGGSATGIAYIVPGKVVCDLMGRSQ